MREPSRPPHGRRVCIFSFLPNAEEGGAEGLRETKEKPRKTEQDTADEGKKAPPRLWV